MQFPIHSPSLIINYVKSRINLQFPRLPFSGFTMVHCLHRIQGVTIPGFLGLWLLTGTPPQAKKVDNLGDR